ncbi:hypothetical protein BMS3Bbin06_01899 [bacterium BMS3Bbin06]|nr:hypothetical protein BMS3Bbin06_01899 [bacterium BMS3Bbin06]
MSRNITLYIKDILQNMSDAEDFISGMSYEQFTNDQKTLNAVLRSIEVIGEAARIFPTISATCVRIYRVSTLGTVLNLYCLSLKQEPLKPLNVVIKDQPLIQYLACGRSEEGIMSVLGHINSYY